MEQAIVSPAVWDRLLARRAGATAGPDPRWSRAERAGWELYGPLASAGGPRSGANGTPVAGGGRARPFLFAQVGQSLDGRIATVSGDARDVSGQDGLAHLHRCRALADAVMVGVRTALHDDPRLTVRLVPGPSPARIVIDPRGRLPNDARLLADDGARRIVVQATDTERPEGVEVARLPAAEGWFRPSAVAKLLAHRGLGSVLVEGGGVTIAGFLEAGLLQRLHVSIAPLIIGAGPAGLRTAPIASLADALRPETRIYGLGDEVVFDCALAEGGTARRSAWPTVQEAPALAARRA
jgi:riboflavin-specific deaminase-like protein